MAPIIVKSWLKDNWVLVIVGVVVLILLSLLIPRGNMTHEGGSWYTTYRSSFPEQGGNIKLYRKTSYGRRKIAERAYVMRVYPNDCIVYQPGSDVGVIYVACGTSKPRPIASYPPWRMRGHYQATPEGLRRVDPARIDDQGRVVVPTETISLEQLQRAATEPGFTVTPVLRDEPVDLNARGDYGRTALLEAIIDGEPAVVRAMLDAGADPNVADSGRVTPLQAAAGGLDAKQEIVELLLGAGANPCTRTHTDDRLEEIVIGNEPLRAKLRAAAVGCK